MKEVYCPKCKFETDYGFPSSYCPKCRSVLKVRIEPRTDNMIYTQQKIEKKCKNCIFRYNNECRRFPSKLVESGDDRFPLINEEEFCGEFKEK